MSTPPIPGLEFPPSGLDSHLANKLFIGRILTINLSDTQIINNYSYHPIVSTLNGTQDGIRTHTVWFLKPLPPSFALPGHKFWSIVLDSNQRGDFIPSVLQTVTFIHSANDTYSLNRRNDKYSPHKPCGTFIDDILTFLSGAKNQHSYIFFVMNIGLEPMTS